MNVATLLRPDLSLVRDRHLKKLMTNLDTDIHHVYNQRIAHMLPHRSTGACLFGPYGGEEDFGASWDWRYPTIAVANPHFGSSEWYYASVLHELGHLNRYRTVGAHPMEFSRSRKRVIEEERHAWDFAFRNGIDLTHETGRLARECFGSYLR
jgi:hypothetical protein